ncbi:MAG TPA: NrsF family protein [Steroidobacteraceae bacterium]
MRTEDLIRALAADGARPVTPIGRILFGALGLGALLSTALFLLILHPRPDIGRALLSVPFDFKLAVVACLAVASAIFLDDVARPASTARHRWVLSLAPVILAAGVVMELSTTAAETWSARLIGHNAVHCLSLIPLLSLPALVCLFFALRRAAPLWPPLAGATAGLLSGGVGAILYALTCPDDSPLFVATWYTLAIGAVATASAFGGGRWLRW